MKLRRFGRMLAAAGTVAFFVVGTAAAASAHADLDSTDPPAGAHVSTAPQFVTLTFGEGVEISLGAIRVYDANGRAVGVSPARHPNGEDTKVAVDLPKLADGSYVVAWRVVSDDGHPVHAAFTFTVGSGASNVKPGLVERLLASDGSSSSVGAVLAIDRFGVFTGIAIGVGGMAFLALVWPAGRVSRRAGLLIIAAFVVAAVASFVMIALQAAYATGQGFSAAFKPSGWRAVLHTASGRWWLVRSIVLVAFVGLAISRSYFNHRVWRAVGLALGAALFVAMAYGGHGAYGRYWGLGLLITVIHLGAMTTWIGGLVMLAVALRETPQSNRVPIARRFSALAFAAVAVLAASGIVQGWRQVGTFDALTSTTYGHLLLVKTGLVVLIVAAAFFSRRFVRTGATDRLGRTVRGEIGVAAAVLVVTALLVNAAPAINEQARPFAASLFSGSRSAAVDITPAKARADNIMHIYVFDPNGTLKTAASITAQISLGARELGPISVPLTSAGLNHAIANDLRFPFAGTWTLEVMAQFGESDVSTFTATVTVR